MRRAPLLVLAFLFLVPRARAGSCLDDGGVVAVSPDFATTALELNDFFATYDYLRQPFAAVFHERVGATKPGCTDDCAIAQSVGLVECGDLRGVAFESITAGYVGEAEGNADAALLPNGKWNVVARAEIAAAAGGMNPTVDGAWAQIELGTREVFDVTSAAAAPQRLDVRLRLGVARFGDFECDGTWYQRPPTGQLHLNIHEDPAGPPQDVSLLASRSYTVLLDETDELISVDVGPNATVYVSTWLELDAYTAGGGYGTTLPSVYCAGGLSLGDASDQEGDPDDADQGLELSMTWSPALTAVPRSGLLYEPVPEPGRAIVAAASLTMLGCIAARRARSTPTPTPPGTRARGPRRGGSTAPRSRPCRRPCGR
jgi:hypothetical protein